MGRRLKRKLAFGAAALAAVGLAGGAYAATQSSGTSPRQAFLNDVAKRLNVSPQQLRAAMRGAFLDRLNAAVAAGRLTQAQANAIKQHMLQGGPLPFAPGMPGPGFRMHRLERFGHHHAVLGAAAQYLGLTDMQLFDQLRSGKSLAQVAKARGKSTSGLKDAITAAVKTRLDNAVSARLLTSAQEQQILSRLSSRLDTLINRTPMAGPRFFRGRGAIGPAGYGPPPMPPAGAAGPMMAPAGAPAGSGPVY